MFEAIDPDADFKIKHDQTARKEVMHLKFNDYVIDFEIKRGDQVIKFPVLVSGDNVVDFQTTKLAAHLLHLDLVQLAKQTESFQLSAEELKNIVIDEEKPVRPRALSKPW